MFISIFYTVPIHDKHHLKFKKTNQNPNTNPELDSSPINHFVVTNTVVTNAQNGQAYTFLG